MDFFECVISQEVETQSTTDLKTVQQQSQDRQASHCPRGSNGEETFTRCNDFYQYISACLLHGVLAPLCFSLNSRDSRGHSHKSGINGNGILCYIHNTYILLKTNCNLTIGFLRLVCHPDHHDQDIGVHRPHTLLLAQHTVPASFDEDI